MFYKFGRPSGAGALAAKLFAQLTEDDSSGRLSGTGGVCGCEAGNSLFATSASDVIANAASGARKCHVLIKLDNDDVRERTDSGYSTIAVSALTLLDAADNVPKMPLSLFWAI